MKKRIVGGIILLVLIALPIVLYWLLLGNDDSMRDGVYRITDSDEYPDAYIEIKDDVIWIHNIDLNSIYQEKVFETYKKRQENMGVYDYSEEEFKKASDYNYVFGERGYSLKYVVPVKDGTFITRYYCSIDESFFSLRFVYDSFKQTIVMDNQFAPMSKFTFKKD